MHYYPLNLLYPLLSFDLTIIIGQNLKHCPTNNKDKDVDYVKVPNHAAFLSPSRAYSFMDSFINIINNYLQSCNKSIILLRTM